MRLIEPILASVSLLYASGLRSADNAIVHLTAGLHQMLFPEGHHSRGNSFKQFMEAPQAG